MNFKKNILSLAVLFSLALTGCDGDDGAMVLMVKMAWTVQLAQMVPMAKTVQMP
ncbi:hypothetical protein GCM10023333_18680 [Ferrimonas pelagia]|uniref:Lipoprotein n=1 Tax=Ferrimonas pelagia TaxID=1177826 RepID=A0ABP9EU25_9GAMM